MNNNELQENKMGVLPIPKLLLSMAWPSILSMTINALYNIVDSIFVAKLSEDALTAVTLITPIQMLTISLGVGSAIGINSLIARRLGEKNQGAADSAASIGLWIGIFNSLIFVMIGLFLAKPFMAKYAEVGSYIFNAGTTYLRIVCMYSVFLLVSISLERILQATGNMIMPMMISISGAIVNIILDPIMIFGLFGCPRFEVAGAAYATVIGQAVGLIVGFILYKREKNKLIDMHLFKFNFSWKVVGDIYRVGIPTIIMQSIGSVLGIFMNMILVSYSTTAVAVMGVYNKMQSFIFMPTFGMNQGSIPIMGYNYGAHNKKRLLETIRVAYITAGSIMIIGTLIFQFGASSLLALFDATEEMYKLGIPALRTISLSFIPASICIVNISVFNATGHGMLGLYASFLRQIVVLLPLAYWFINSFGIRMLWFAWPIAEITSLIFSYLMLHRIKKNEFAKL